jgi:hypothetical protein
MIRELETVVLRHDVPQHYLNSGDAGAVVHRYGNQRDGAVCVEVPGRWGLVRFDVFVAGRKWRSTGCEGGAQRTMQLPGLKEVEVISDGTFTFSCQVEGNYLLVALQYSQVLRALARTVGLLPLISRPQRMATRRGAGCCPCAASTHADSNKTVARNA